MDWNKKNKWASLVAALVSLASVSANADANDMQLRNLDNRVSALESKRGSAGIINPSVNPTVKDGLDLDLMAEFLYWKNSAQDNVIGQQAGSTTAASSYGQGREIHAGTDWAPGFRVGIGYVLPHDGWDMRLSYLRIRNNSSKDDSNDNGIFPRFPAGFVPATGTLPTSLTATGKAVLNMIDFEMGRAFYTSKFFTLRPFIGVRNMWYKEEANVTYTGGSSNTFLGPDAQLGYSSKNWHIGMRAGLDTTLTFGAGFSMYGNASAAILYGNQNQYASYAATTTTSESAFYKNSRFVADIAAGFAYDVLLADDTFGLQLKTGWNQLSSTDLSAGGDSFAYQGWTFAAKLSF